MARELLALDALLPMPKGFDPFDLHNYLVPFDAPPPVTQHEADMRYFAEQYVVAPWRYTRNE